MLLTGNILGPTKEISRYIQVLNHVDIIFLAVLSMISAALGIFFTFIIQRLFLGETQFKYPTSMMISVLLSVSASVLILTQWFTIASRT